MQQRAAVRICQILLVTSTLLGAVFCWPRPQGATALFLFTSMLASCVLCFSCVLLALTVIVAMFRAARAAQVEASIGDLDVEMQIRASRDGQWAHRTALWTGAFAVTAVLFALVQLLLTRIAFLRHSHDRVFIITLDLLGALVILADAVACSGSILLLGGFVGPPIGQIFTTLTRVGDQVRKQRERNVRRRLQYAATRRGNKVSTIAALMNGKSADQVFEDAVKRFRCVSWDDLTYEVFAGGGVSNNDGFVAPSELLDRSKLTCFGNCDAFLSHSWHDDVDAKWVALCKWSEAFRQKHGRSPTLWVDKVCIDQTSIVDDLQCLPVFLGACNSLLILSGQTYTSRLWCILELYVFFSMRTIGNQYGVDVHLRILGDKSEVQKTLSTWENFDATKCTCFDLRDKENIFSVIEKGRGGIEGFNARVQKLMHIHADMWSSAVGGSLRALDPSCSCRCPWSVWGHCKIDMKNSVHVGIASDAR